MPEKRHATLRAEERFNALENIVTHDRGSFLVVVVGEDPVYVVGYTADIRGLIVNSDRQRWLKEDILLRIGIAKELSPRPDALTYGGSATS